MVPYSGGLRGTRGADEGHVGVSGGGPAGGGVGGVDDADPVALWGPRHDRGALDGEGRAAEVDVVQLVPVDEAAGRHVPALTLLLTACGSGTDDTATASARADAVPTADVVSAIKKDEAAAKLLPSGTTSRTLAVSVSGQPPGTSILDDGKTLAGQDVDFANAVAKVLGIRLKTEQASFEAILPALGSGKYDLGVGNFGVTDERRRTIDFVTYINDGQGFATRSDSKLTKITDLTQLCGLNVATCAGTTFEATLVNNKHLCTKSYKVQTYNEQGAIWPSLQQGRSDVVMSTINGLRYAAAHQQGV